MKAKLLPISAAEAETRLRRGLPVYAKGNPPEPYRITYIDTSGVAWAPNGVRFTPPAFFKPGKPEELDRRDLFIRELAHFLTADQARRSIELEMGKPDAKAWARLRNAGPMLGYATTEEAEAKLKEFLA